MKLLVIGLKILNELRKTYILLSFSKVTYLTFWRDGIIFDIFITTAEYDTLYDKKVSGNTVWNPFFTSQWWQHGYSISDSRNFLYHSNIFNVTTNTIDALITGEIHVDTEWMEKIGIRHKYLNVI